ncbi:MAG: Putative transmembrane protein [Rhodanobacteraceae bacterium]|nr:MAG: Putative transmembrane protein [Rhodanobacteraceae bacterium]
MHTARGLADWLGPTVLLLLRVWVALAFWRAGVVKFEDPGGTLFLFNTTYQVPLLPPDVAAVASTWIELVVPWLVGLGIAGRLSALFLFIYNIIAFVSFPALWPHGFWAGLFSTSAFADHKVWGLMLLAVIAWGPGRWSLDTLFVQLVRTWQARRRPVPPT